MGDLCTAGSHPARKLGLCAARGGAERHRRSPSCARRAGKGRVSGLGGRVGVLKSCPYANLRAGVAGIPNPRFGGTFCNSFFEAIPGAGACATQVRDCTQHPRPRFRRQTAQLATICTVLHNLQKRKQQKRKPVSARRRTERSVRKREVQATRMKPPPSASVSGRLLARQRPVQNGAQHLLRQPPPEMNICSGLSRYLCLAPPPCGTLPIRYNLAS